MGKLKPALLHLIVWLAFICYAITVYGYGHHDWVGTSYEIIISYSISAGVFYTTALFAYPRVFEKKKYLSFVVVCLLIMTISILLRFAFAFIIYPYVFQKDLILISKDNYGLALKFSFQWFTFSLFASGYWAAKSRIEISRKLAQKTADEARQQKLELENEALRAQINPHFIFNTLDPFRVRTAEILPEVSMGIGWFMQIIRAGITSPGADGKIPLEIELNAIEGLIYIHKQRFSNIGISHISIVKDEDKISILPHILLPFVENAFKHGVYDDPDNKLRIEINVDLKSLRLLVFNKKNNRIKDRSNGIGLRYIKRHLDSGYQNKYKLNINETEEDYTVNLSIQLN